MVRGPRYVCGGFSLVELLLALTLGLIVIAGMAQLFRGTGRGHASMESAARSGESGRYALAFLGHSARNAGFLGCDSRSPRIVNTLNGDLGALFELNITRAVEAFDDDGGGSAAAYAGAAGIDPGRIAPGTDIVTFRRLEGPFSRVLAPVDANPVVEEGDSFELEADDFLLIGDCEQSSLFRLTGVIHGGGSAVLLRETGSGSHENSAIRALTDGGRVYGPGGAAGGARVGRVMTENLLHWPGARRRSPRRADEVAVAAGRRGCFRRTRRRRS